MPSRSSELRRARPLLGTLVEIRAAGAADALAPAIEAGFAAIERVQRLMSFHDEHSDVSRLNREASRRAVEVAPETREVLSAAAGFAAASGGVFDITVGRELVAWGYLPAHEFTDPGDDAGDWRDIVLRQDGRVEFARPLTIDLGGIAKGYAVDRACAALEAEGIRDYVVNAGGDLRVGAAAEPVSVRHPASPGSLVPLAVLSRAAIATSGSYFAARRRRGRMIQPLVMPWSRRPARGTASVSVISSDCMTSDALTKIVGLLDGEAAPLLRDMGAEALVLQADGSSRCVGAGAARTQETAWN